ncbi:MAG: hypothetical protein IV093_05045 [Rubrivivax sp.]|nr:hypothetical protein [Rubrivivax sp.]
MADPAAFAKLMPGFDFLQGLVQKAGSSLPGVGAWIAPSLDPEELEKRIRDLRTVQFWLEQNAKLLGGTIQALEVQRMTLATLKTMNVPVDAMRESFKMRVPEPAPEPAAAPAPATAPAPAAEAPSGPVPDPMQWWTSLTQQFGEIAAKAMADAAPAAAAAAAPARKPVAKAALKPAAKTTRKTAPRKRRSP